MKILVTGANGLVGCSLMRIGPTCKNHHFIFVGRLFGDLTKERNVERMYKATTPDYVIHLAAKVGGVNGNMIGPADFFNDNILMDTYMIKYAYKYNVKKFIGMSSVCVFPDGLKILQEDLMHNGPPHSSNFAYAYAKRMLEIQMEAYRRQYGVTNYCTVIPTNMYGPNDNYSLKTGHVIPSLIHKIHLAKKNNTDLTVWGDGTPRREFLFVDDMSQILLELLDIEILPSRLLVSSLYNYTINDIVNNLCVVSEFKGSVSYDITKPMGQQERPTDTSKLYNLLPHCKLTSLFDGLMTSYKWFESNYPTVRK